MKLKKCKECKDYTMNDKCPKCNTKASDAHYKFIRNSQIKTD
jgi:rRNA maturation protein Nop10